MMTPTERAIGTVVRSVVEKYWLGYPPYMIRAYIERHVFEIGLLARRLGNIREKTLIDVGGGWGTFASSCSALGMKVTLIDDFGDAGAANLGDPRHSMPTDCGVTVMRRDVIKEGLGLPRESVDAVTTFDMIEHLHCSPKKLLHDAMGALRPDGVLILGVPNNVNLRKRLTVPFGRGEWSPFTLWYEAPTFRGHVREPSVQDLCTMARDLSLRDYTIVGANWLGLDNDSKLLRTGVRLLDGAMRFFPSICSDLYLAGYR